MRYFGMICLGLAVSGCIESSDQNTEVKQPAATPAQTSAGSYAEDPNRKFPERVLWGDEHVHTGWSADAGLTGTILNPEDAVHFAMGKLIKSSSGVDMQLHRPLDWIAVTDHSDGMGTFNQLVAGNPEFLADPTARRWLEMMQRGGDEGVQAKREAINAQATKTLPAVFTNPKWMVTAWHDNVDIMEKYNKPGDFTAFLSFEWTSNGEDGQNLHRNILFRDDADKVRATPPLTTFVSSVPGRAGTDPESLWNWLANWEDKTGGRALAIPHNGNMSNGWMFREARYDGSPMTSKWAADRQRWERLYEIYQYKGSGEAHPSLALNDEFANFGIWDTADLNGNPKKPGDIKTEYWRDALKNGMIAEMKLGTNPFRYGAAAGTDTHTGLSTGGEEDNFGGKFPQNEPAPGRWNQVYKKEGDFIRRDWTLMAQGITGVWAIANSRAAIWDAMYRRETYASSGPRIKVRFFGGYDFTASDAGRDMAAVGYAKGVPMGGELRRSASNKAPRFLFAAMKDPDGANLDRVQIVKAWVDANGAAHEKIYDVKWGGPRKRKADGSLPAVGNTVDLKTARYSNSIGATQLVGMFSDPDFNPAQRAVYYARVIEIPTPRWTLFDTVKFGDKMSKDVPMVQQERAVTSPIWYIPG